MIDDAKRLAALPEEQHDGGLSMTNVLRTILV